MGSPRHEHSALQYPVSVKGVVIRDGRVVLLENERGEWELPGGKLAPLETPESCVAREITEELGLQVRAGPILDAWVYYPTRAARVLILTYGCYETARREAVLSHEHKSLRWFSLEDVDGLAMPEGYKASIGTWARHPGALAVSCIKT